MLSAVKIKLNNTNREHFQKTELQCLLKVSDIIDKVYGDINYQCNFDNDSSSDLAF